MKVWGLAGLLYRSCLALVLVLLAAVSPSLAASVRLYWDPNPNTDQVLGYVLVYGPSTGHYTQSVWLPAGTLTHEVSGLAAGTYYFAIRAYNADGDSGYSNEVRVDLAEVAAMPAPAPTITSFGPAFGPLAGGTEVAVTGANYQTGATVYVGGRAATVTSVTSTRIVFRTPAAPTPGLVAISVLNPDGQGVQLSSAFTYRAPVPTITKVNPAVGSASGGTLVTITGTGFLPGATVSVDAVPAEVVSVSASALVVRMPAHAPARVGLTATNPDGQFVWAGAAYTYTADGPAITHVLPANGPAAGGSTVTILGTGFTVGSVVRMGGVLATVLSVAADTITVAAPAHDAGSVDVTVTTPAAVSVTKAASYTYEAADAPFRRYFAEGAAGFFQTRFAVTNPNDEPVPVTATFSDTSGNATPLTLTVPARTRITIDESNRPPLLSEAFATTFEAPKTLGVERTMTWASGGVAYGSHAETGVESPRTTWVLAEGATINNFNTFYLLLNPTDSTAEVKVQYLLSTGQRLEKLYTVLPHARTNVWVNKDDPLLEAAEMSATITSLNGVPIVVERSMYRNNGNELFTAGTSATAADVPALRWFLAEGATLGLFDEFVLIANPNPSPATLRVSYLRANAEPIVKYYTANAYSRLTLWVDFEEPALASAEVSVVVESLTPTPVVVERAMWWRSTADGEWEEGHGSLGSTKTGARWLAVDCEAGGAGDANTWVLVANTGNKAEVVQFTLITETGETRVLTDTVGPNARYTLDTLGVFPEIKNRRYSVMVEAKNPQAPLVVERSTYSSIAGKYWAAGTNSLAVPLPLP